VTYLEEDFPVFWERASGCEVEDVDGNRFLDFTSAFAVTSLGHANPSVSAAIARQLEKLPHGMGDVHPPAIKVDLLEKLTALFPEPGATAILSSSGAEAVESALKTAFLATGRPCILSFEGAYHGLTYGTLAASAPSKFREPFESQLPALSRTLPLPRERESSLRRIAEALDDTIGAILFEPIFGRAGVVVPPEGWMKGLRELATKRGVLLIADEVMTGFGRTGERFAVNREGIVPDLLCVGKALTGALPFSACIGRKSVMNAWPTSTGEALHTSTFLGHPLGCAAALASIEEIERLHLSQRAAELGSLLLDDLRKWNFPAVSEVRGRGLLIGVELRGEAGVAFRCATRALREGLILLPSGPEGRVVSITPPLTIERSDLDRGVAILRGILESFS
jgi:4-aminobutyrate aminotransferase/(S)-3-amino-2-methylpropionate transaminase